MPQYQREPGGKVSERCRACGAYLVRGRCPGAKGCEIHRSLARMQREARSAPQDAEGAALAADRIALALALRGSR